MNNLSVGQEEHVGQLAGQNVVPKDPSSNRMGYLCTPSKYCSTPCGHETFFLNLARSLDQCNSSYNFLSTFFFILVQSSSVLVVSYGRKNRENFLLRNEADLPGTITYMVWDTSRRIKMILHTITNTINMIFFSCNLSLEYRNP